MTNSAISPTPLATALSSSRNRRSRWTSYMPAKRNATIPTRSTSGSARRYSASAGTPRWLLNSPEWNRTEYASSHAPAMRARSHRRNHATSD